MFQNALNRHFRFTCILPLHILCFMFHFYVLTYWLSILLKAETLNFDVSFLLSMFHSQKHSGRKTKTLWERFQNTVGAIQKHWGSDNALPQCFEKWNMKLKMKHRSSMFHFSKWLIFNELKHKNETWKINQRFWIRMDICSINCNLSNRTRIKINEIINVQLMIINVQNNARSA